MRWYTLWNIRGTFAEHCSMKCCEVCNRFTCVYNLRKELITNDIWWSVKDCSTKWLRIPWNILRGTLVFRPILTLILTEISAWNIMFHGASFNYKSLILCVLLGWFLCAGLLNKKVHFPDAKVCVISIQTSIAPWKTFFTPFLWTRALVCATKTTVFCINSVRYFFEMPSRTLRDSFQIAHSLCHCGLDPQSHTRSIRRNTLRLYFLDRMGCRVEPGRTRARNKRLPKGSKCSLKVLRE